MYKVIETENLILRHFGVEDAPFIVELLLSPAWLQYIGDRGVRNEADAEQYLLQGSIKSYAEKGFGFYGVEEKKSQKLIGMCGLIKRDSLEDVDIGFAFLPEYIGKGYGYEATSATLQYAFEKLALLKVIAIVSIENKRSVALLEKIGFRYEKKIIFPPKKEELMLFVSKK